MAKGTVDQYEVSFAVDGRFIGVADDMSGGALDSMEKKHRPGGMGDEESLGGQSMIENITMTFAFDRARDQDTIRFLINRRGKGRGSVNKQPLDADGNPFGRAFVYGGSLKKVTLSDAKADGGDVDHYIIELSTDGQVA